MKVLPLTIALLAFWLGACVGDKLSPSEDGDAKAPVEATQRTTAPVEATQRTTRPPECDDAPWGFGSVNIKDAADILQSEQQALLSGDRTTAEARAVGIERLTVAADALARAASDVALTSPDRWSVKTQRIIVDLLRSRRSTALLLASLYRVADADASASDVADLFAAIDESASKDEDLQYELLFTIQEADRQRAADCG